MKVIDVYNPDQALYSGLSALVAEGATCPSRNGPVIRFKTPVTSVYHKPMQRVSFNMVRDANPFMHLMEALWMLAGRNDVETVGYYAKQMLAYTDDGKTLNGAYGYRWRQYFGYDQLEYAIAELRANSGSRRVVISMWNGLDCSWSQSDLLNQTSRDLPCNTSVMFDAQLGQLNMTVTNRSNDMIWGAYGANAVHFSMLHEYVADRVGLPLGTYYQMSNNLHVYTEFEISQRFLGTFGDLLTFKTEAFAAEPNGFRSEDLYRVGVVAPLPMGAQGDNWDADLYSLVNNYKSEAAHTYSNEFFTYVAEPMRQAYVLWKAGQTLEAQDLLAVAHATYARALEIKEFNDWLTAGSYWMGRRLQKTAI